MEEKIKSLYADTEQYVMDNDLPYTLKALHFIKELNDGKITNSSIRNRFLTEALHCLQVADMLIDLHLPLENNEIDKILAVAILHIYPEVFTKYSMNNLLMKEYGFSQEIVDILNIVVPENLITDNEMHRYYESVQSNRDALLIVLADRGNVVQQLHRYSTWNAHRYIDETKACYYPMCVYGKEHYHELLAPISVLMEKMRSLIEVSEILLSRYETREAELIQDILALREENATIKGIIAKFKAEG